MSDNFLPTRDADLLAWSANFSQGINADPQELGLSVQQAAEYADLHAAFAARYAISSDPATQTRGSVVFKDDVRKAMKLSARQLARIIRAQPNVSAAQRIELGLAVRISGGAAAAIPAPEERPRVEIVKTSGRRVNLKLRQSGKADRARPKGVAGAIVLSFVGQDPPADLRLWTFERCTSRTSVEVDFPASIAPGAKVHLAASWYIPRGDHGPMSLPVSTYLGEGVAQAA